MNWIPGVSLYMSIFFFVWGAFLFWMLGKVYAHSVRRKGRRHNPNATKFYFPIVGGVIGWFFGGLGQFDRIIASALDLTVAYTMWSIASFLLVTGMFALAAVMFTNLMRDGVMVE